MNAEDRDSYIEQARNNFNRSQKRLRWFVIISGIIVFSILTIGVLRNYGVLP